MRLPTHPIAAAVAITDPDDLILMVLAHHRTELVLPGGMVEAGESPAAAAVREVREEVGLAITVTALLGVSHSSATAALPAVSS